MNRIRKTAAFILVFAVILSGLRINIKADEVQFRLNVGVSVDGADIMYIPAFDNEYENNLFISLKGLAYCLKDTSKAFTPVIENKKINIATGSGFDGEVYPWSDDELSNETKASDSKHELIIDGNGRKYYSFIVSRDGGSDAFFTPLSLSMMLDVKINVTDEKIEINTSEPYSLSMEEAEDSGYLQGVNALVTGDGSTGEIFYGYKQDEPFSIASTTKLMTYLVFMDEVSAGNCAYDGTATVSKRAAKLSRGSDGVIKLTEGMSVPVNELLYGMLLPSSNECALTLAEYTAGSETAFVKLMNEKAEELGLTNALFYNSHGLPFYDDQLVPAKVQNHMTAEEMFILASEIMNKYPQITDITSTKLYHLDTLGRDVKNTNGLLYNIDNAVGLKTGTTTRAGACLVTCVRVEKDGNKHNLITVLLGAEEDSDRGTASEIAARYGLKYLEENGSKPVKKEEDKEDDNKIPSDPELVVKKLIKMLDISK